MKPKNKRICKCCEKAYSQAQVKRVYGANSSPAILGYCSASCYTVAIGHKSHVLYSNDPITKLF